MNNPVGQYLHMHSPAFDFTLDPPPRGSAKSVGFDSDGDGVNDSVAIDTDGDGKLSDAEKQSAALAPQHRPAPWSANGSMNSSSTQLIADADGRTFIAAFCDEGTRRLVLAAPTMLRLLRTIVAAHSRQRETSFELSRIEAFEFTGDAVYAGKHARASIKNDLARRALENAMSVAVAICDDLPPPAKRNPVKAEAVNTPAASR